MYTEFNVDNYHHSRGTFKSIIVKVTELVIMPKFGAHSTVNGFDVAQYNIYPIILNNTCDIRLSAAANGRLSHPLNRYYKYNP